MTGRYVIGGMAFLVDEDLPDLATEGFADAEIRVTFSDDAVAGSADGHGMRSVSGPMDLTGTIDPESGNCRLPALHEDPVDRAWQLRQMAPIFSAVLGRLVLHAGAVEMDGGGGGALVGESTAGKSTLVRFLTDRGHRFIADDLLPVRFTPEPCVPVGDRLAPLRMIAFLRRTDTDTIVAEPLGGVDALQGLVLNGFGEHGDASSWAFQFDAYHRLADSIPAFDLAIPDDLDALPLVERALADLLDRTAEPGDIS